jgi:hypothetical protein
LFIERLFCSVSSIKQFISCVVIWEGELDSQAWMDLGRSGHGLPELMLGE